MAQPSHTKICLADLEDVTADAVLLLDGDERFDDTLVVDHEVGVRVIATSPRRYSTTTPHQGAERTAVAGDVDAVPARHVVGVEDGLAFELLGRFQPHPGVGDRRLGDVGATAPERA